METVMSDERDDQPREGGLSDEELARALPGVAARQAPAPSFRQQLEARLGVRGVDGPSPRLSLPRPKARLNRRHAVAVLAFAAGAALVLVVAARPGRNAALAPVTATVPAEEPVVLRAPDGRTAGVAVQSTDRLVVRLELRDGAEVTYWPTSPPRLELAQGFVRLVAGEPVRVRAASDELLIETGADVALELRESPLHQGGPAMRPIWLIPTSAGSGAALTLAVLVASGRVDLLHAGATTATAGTVPPGQVVVRHPEAGATVAPRRVAELEQKVSALKQENGVLAGKLAQKSGVTLDQVRERILGLARTPLGGLLAPGAMTDVLTDLKGLGPAGVEAMIKMLKSPKSSERFLAAKLLEDLSAPAAIGALKEMALTEQEEMNANMASHALAFIDDPAAVPALREIADNSKSWGSQVNALWALCKHGDKKAIDQSLAWVKDQKRSPQARAALGANLMLLPDPELLPIVDQTLKDFGSEQQVALFAAQYYKTAGIPEGRDRLQAMANDPKLSEAARKAAKDALSGTP
jgi:hypothetical protein